MSSDRLTVMSGREATQSSNADEVHASAAITRTPIALATITSDLPF
jgi:hypothetical protein